MLEILEGEYKEICKRVGKSKKLSVLDMLIIMLGNDHDAPESRKIIELLNCKAGCPVLTKTTKFGLLYLSKALFLPTLV